MLYKYHNSIMTCNGSINQTFLCMTYRPAMTYNGAWGVAMFMANSRYDWMESPWCVRESSEHEVSSTSVLHSHIRFLSWKRGLEWNSKCVRIFISFKYPFSTIFINLIFIQMINRTNSTYLYTHVEGSLDTSINQSILIDWLIAIPSNIA